MDLAWLLGAAALFILLYFGFRAVMEALVQICELLKEIRDLLKAR